MNRPTPFKCLTTPCFFLCSLTEVFAVRELVIHNRIHERNACDVSGELLLAGSNEWPHRVDQPICLPLTGSYPENRKACKF